VLGAPGRRRRLNLCSFFVDNLFGGRGAADEAKEVADSVGL
jgi:hypothetical protein